MRASEKRIVYVLKTASVVGRYYVGITDDVDERLDAHNNGRCLHTTKYRPWALHVAIEFSTQQVAARFERYLKTGSGRAFAKRHFE